MIDKPTVQRILDAADIVEVVSDYVHLTRRGSNFMGLCPFHNEKTPSFSVSRSRNICHCFSCGKGGSPVNFVMEKEGINYHDALLHLAKKYGIKVEERQLTDKERQQQSEREAMLTANEWAMQTMQANLTDTDEGKDVGLQYLYQRGVTQNAIKEFRLGYALDKSAALYTEALNKGYEQSVLEAVGLCGVSQSGRPYDRFRGRVIFPILNSAGKVVAFGGRGIKGEPAKYINSPESALYVKSNELYGIYQARNAIVKNNKCFLVEGYMDVIGMWQSGMENVVASSGTSLTEGQIALIHRFTENVTLIYDGDAAGIKASLRGIDLLLSQNLNIRVLLLPDGDDPDSFARKHTPDEFKAFVDAHEVDFIEFKTQILTSSAHGTVNKADAIKSIVQSIASVSDMIKRSLYVQECATRLHIAENVLMAAVTKQRAVVVQEQKKRKDIARIERENRQQQAATTAGGEAQQAPAKAEDSPTVQQSPAPNSGNDILSAYLRNATAESNRFVAPLEENVLKYCVKYGMVAFCPNADAEEDNNNTLNWFNVAEYIREEMRTDSLHFTDPVREKIFNRVISLIDDYKVAAKEKSDALDNEINAKIKEEVDKLAATYLSISELEIKEAEFRSELAEGKLHDMKQFAIDFSARILGSDIDDDVRRFALKAITPIYKLSKYHSKMVKVPSEEDLISDLVPRAISEWKDGLLLMRYKDLQQQLKEASQAQDTKKMELIIEELQGISELRRLVAKTIGDRIVSPWH